MRSSLVMHRRMIMQGIGHVLAGSIETRKTNIHAIHAVLQTSALYFASRNWGNYLIVETLSAFISVDNLVGTGRGEMRDVRTGGGGGGHCGRCVVDGGGGGDRDGRLCGWRRRGRERPFERRQDTMMADCMQTNSTTFERRNDKKTTFQPQNRRENLRIVDRLCAVESGGRFCAPVKVWEARQSIATPDSAAFQRDHQGTGHGHRDEKRRPSWKQRNEVFGYLLVSSLLRHCFQRLPILQTANFIFVIGECSSPRGSSRRPISSRHGMIEWPKL